MIDFFDFILISRDEGLCHMLFQNGYIIRAEHPSVQISEHPGVLQCFLDSFLDNRVSWFTSSLDYHFTFDGLIDHENKSVNLSEKPTLDCRRLSE